MVTFRSNNSNKIEDLHLEAIIIEDLHLEAIMKGQNFLTMTIFKEKFQVEIIIMQLNLLKNTMI